MSKKPEIVVAIKSWDWKEKRWVPGKQLSTKPYRKVEHAEHDRISLANAAPGNIHESNVAVFSDGVIAETARKERQLVTA